MAHYTPASLESLLKNLTLTDDEADHEEILRHCDGLLSTSKAHPRALHTKIVALLSLDRYDDAIKVIESADGQAVAETATLERAYCLYKLGRLQEAEEAARKAADGGDRNKRGLRHVEAQAVSLFLPTLGAGKVWVS
jgi:signal recognition particle subunit SRP72